jgi:hypothetical protein
MLLLVALCAALLAGLSAPAPARAQERTRCFPETGQCITGRILAYWERNGGLSVFGYPITALAQETIYEEPGQDAWLGPVQWFQRDRLEDHGAEGILAGRLGARQLNNMVVGLLIPPPAPVEGPAPAGCRYFPVTKHNVCQPFLSYWERNGGLERFGYPLSEPFEQTIGAWRGTVQYFERRRMEIHTELSGSPVLLGLLGTELHENQATEPCSGQIIPELEHFVAVQVWFRNQMGCPQPALRDLPAAEQYFENGVMVYVALPASGGRTEGRIYVVRTNPQPVVYSIYADTWTEGQPETGGLTPPPGRIEPKRGFGKLWREQPGLREMLGWGTQPERADRATLQPFSATPGLLWLQDADFVYVFGPGTLMTATGR